MSASGGALFLWQGDRFSSRDADAFNRKSTFQVAVIVNTNPFSTLLQADFQLAFASVSLFSRDSNTRTLSIHSSNSTDEQPVCSSG